MRYLALITDHDGTSASSGKVNEPTDSALERLQASGRRAVLVTGRRLDDLLTVCPRLEPFDYVVENGGVLYEPLLRFVRQLQDRTFRPDPQHAGGCPVDPPI
jgi:hydroxymethylpyrimidine pyrophosphatase-like HAD family hydrolase